jgi:hypothetical protein
MSRFSTQFRRTAAPNLQRQFGEPVVYYRGDGVQRDISAMITRDPLAIIAELGDTLGVSMIVEVRNDATYGITSSEVDTAVDQIGAPLRTGEAAAVRSIVRVLSDSGAYLRLALQ